MINYLLIAFIALLVFFIVRGSRRGMLLIIYGLVGWIFMIWLINYSTPIVKEYIYNNTEISTSINEKIYDKLSSKYEKEEQDNPGDGLEELKKYLPIVMVETVQEGIENYEELVIRGISDALTTTTIDGLSAVFGLVAGIILIKVGEKLIKLCGYIPGIKEVNKIFGIAAGFIEGMLAIWLIMFIASSFPTTTFGQYIIVNSTSSYILNVMYENNIIAHFLA
ncbi:MAG: CvpA family protein [Pseudobutyrivibrio sp.]|nr:CvpA family protein [Pseudobutyrivibrio sp.]